MALALVLPSPSAEAKPDKPVRATPSKGGKHRRERRRERDDSLGGTRKGGLEFALGSVATVVFGVLIGRGAWELREGRQLSLACDEGTTTDPACNADDPARGNKIGAGLSFGFAVPVGVAAGLLFAYGVEVHRDYRAWQRRQVSMAPFGGPRGGGLRLRVRF